MAKILISGGEPLHGEVGISGAKNAVLPILASCLLADEPVAISNVPHLHDVTTFIELLGQMATDQVSLSLGGELDPGLWKPMGADDYVGVIMPMRI